MCWQWTETYKQNKNDTVYSFEFAQSLFLYKYMSVIYPILNLSTIQFCYKIIIWFITPSFEFAYWPEGKNKIGGKFPCMQYMYAPDFFHLEP